MQRRNFVKRSAQGVMILGSRNFSMPVEEMWTPKKTDTHVHLFNLNRFEYSWLKNVPKIDRSFTLEDFSEATHACNVRNILFMESGADQKYALQEALWVTELARNDKRIKGLIAKMDLSEKLWKLSEFQELKKIAILKGGRGTFLLDRPDFVDNLKYLGDQRLTFDILLPADQLEKAAGICHQSPGTTFILDHVGHPDYQSGGEENWKKGIDALSQLSNVYCKVSGMISRIGVQWTLEQLRPVFNYVFMKFGPDRLLYGGDWPVVLLADSYQSWSNAFNLLISGYSRSVQNKMAHKNADRIYDL